MRRPRRTPRCRSAVAARSRPHRLPTIVMAAVPAASSRRAPPTTRTRPARRLLARASTPAAGPAGVTPRAAGGSGDELRATRVPRVLLLGERPVQHAVQCRAPANRTRIGLQVRPQRLRLGAPPEGRGAGEALVEHARQRVAVRAAVDLLATDLLRGQVVERPDHLAGVHRVALGRLGDAEVREVGMARLVEQHVARLHVAMDEAAIVRGVECARDLCKHLDCPLGCELPFTLERRHAGRCP